MKRGDVVKIKKTGIVGIICWKKNNHEIGINIGHYAIVLGTRGKCELTDLLGLGIDCILSKEDLILI